MRKYQWGNRNPQCGHLTIEEIEYRKMRNTFYAIMAVFVAVFAVAEVLWLL